MERLFGQRSHCRTGWFVARACGLLATLLVGGALALADPGTPPLVQAAEEGNLGKLAKLLERGADPNAHDAWRNTALIYAARDGRGLHRGYRGLCG